MKTWTALGVGLLGLVATGAQAQTIYPITRAEILAGSKFDFKVEFPGAPAQGAVKVTINGQDPASVLGQSAKFVEKEDGGEHSAYWIRGAQIAKPGMYNVEATLGEKKASVKWEVFGTPERKAKNVILFVGDGLSVAHRTAARMLSKGITEGRYNGELAMDDMPHMALVSTSGTDSIVTDSANAMSAYTTGHKSCVNALGVYCAKNKSTLDHPKVETLGELAKRRNGGMAVGVVTNSEIEDATPAGMVAHTRRRADYNDIVKMFHDVKPDVIMGGGSPNFLAKSTPGSKRTDEDDYIKKFEADGYKFVSTKQEMQAAAQAGSSKVLGLFNTSNIDGALDLKILKKGTVSKFPDQPDLVEQTKAALDVLSKNQNGFVLMVESARIDKYSHSLDPERAIYDTIMLDNAIQTAKDFAAKKDDTLIIVVGDHAHGVSIVGTYDDDTPGNQLRDKLGIYADAKFPNYPAPNAEGYPEKVDVSRRLAMLFTAYPDYCETGRPYMNGENVPTVKAADGKTYVANEEYCKEPLAARRIGNLPLESNSGVHTADDLVLTAMGPGSEQFKARMENTRVFRVMTTALGLGAGQ
ncbi:alkaline phosphatase [Microvirga sp. 2MCAF38]|uniref:alkaline phosphatase n=1 Tax=Microvirga sp. 2MCAF38 TaxID=3232989 RepID=UPI003F9C112C